MSWHYLSFAEEKFLGGLVIEADSFTHAHMRSHTLGLNPGGSVMGWELLDEQTPAEKYRNRLLTKAEVFEMWPDARSIKELEDGSLQ